MPNLNSRIAPDRASFIRSGSISRRRTSDQHKSERAIRSPPVAHHDYAAPSQDTRQTSRSYGYPDPGASMAEHQSLAPSQHTHLFRHGHGHGHNHSHQHSQHQGCEHHSQWRTPLLNRFRSNRNLGMDDAQAEKAARIAALPSGIALGIGLELQSDETLLAKEADEQDRDEAQFEKMLLLQRDIALRIAILDEQQAALTKQYAHIQRDVSRILHSTTRLHTHVPQVRMLDPHTATALPLKPPSEANGAGGGKRKRSSSPHSCGHHHHDENTYNRQRQNALILSILACILVVLMVIVWQIDPLNGRLAPVFSTFGSLTWSCTSAWLSLRLLEEYRDWNEPEEEE